MRKNESAAGNLAANPAQASGHSPGPEQTGARASRISVVEMNRALVEKRDIVIVDVRAAEDFAQDHIPGAVNLPREKWDSATGLSKEKVNVVYCYSHTCPLGGEACARLAGEGYPVVELDGGFAVWQTSDPGESR